MRLLAVAVASTAILGWSDPIAIATTTAAIPPAIAVAGGRVHVFWIDSRSSSIAMGDIWHAVLFPDGRTARTPSKLRTGADRQLAFPVAVSWAGGVAVAWMARTPQGITLEIGLVDADGTLRTIVRPDPIPREEAGRIALMAATDGTLHAAWSQFDRGERMIWYTRLDASGGLQVAPAPVVAGDAPALLLDPAPLLFWWELAGAGGFRLMSGSLQRGRVAGRRALTGTVALVNPLPVLPTMLRGERVLLIPTLERSFSTAGRLYALRVGTGTAPPPRVPALGHARVSDVSLVRDVGTPVAVWSQAVGRRQNSELYAARLDTSRADLLEPGVRLTHTTSGSLKPAATFIGGTPAAVWLEVSGFGQFVVSYGTSALPRRHRFLLGITELDLYRPGALLAYAVLAAVSVLPIAVLVTGATLLPAVLALYVLQLLAAPFHRLEEATHRPVVRFAFVLAATLALQLAVRGMIPGRPAPLVLALPLIAGGLPAFLFLARRDRGTLVAGLVTSAVVLLAAVISLFPWAAAQLTQF